MTMALDAGAQGILAPYCETVDEVKEVVGAAKWRPLKGELVRKAVDAGEFPSAATKDYLAARNANNVCIIGIESVPAIENLENILKVRDIDAIFVGPNDLSITLGIPGPVRPPGLRGGAAGDHREVPGCERADADSSPDGGADDEVAG